MFKISQSNQHMQKKNHIECKDIDRFYVDQRI